GVGCELEGIRPFWTQRALVDRAAGVALDVDELAALGVDELAAPDGAVRADTRGHGRPAEPGRLPGGLRAERLRARRRGQAEHGNPRVGFTAEGAEGAERTRQ